MKKTTTPSPLAKRLLLKLRKIKLARLRRELSLKAVAQRAGISINTVVAIEHGRVGWC